MSGLASLLAAVSFSAGTSSAELRIVVWPDGRDRGGARTWTLRCAPSGGTLPRPAAACRQLSAAARPFAPVPEDMACTEIYGGPQVARVTGTFRGRRVWATFRRTDGCEIARWNRIRLLFPVASGPT